MVRLPDGQLALTYGVRARPFRVEAKLSVDQLVALHLHANEWFPRQARLELTLRALDGRGVAGRWAGGGT